MDPGRPSEEDIGLPDSWLRPDEIYGELNVALSASKDQGLIQGEVEMPAIGLLH